MDQKKKEDKRELHEHRLTTVDETGHRVYIQPEEVRGRYKTRRYIVYWIGIVLFFILPWIRVGGRQQFLLNIGERKFILFGQIFWGHDAPFIIFFLAFFIFSLALVTAIWGRLWCGWACPQTVFIDAVYRKIDGFIEGSALKRRKLDLAPWNGEKILKRAIKWSLFILVSTVFAHGFLAYFVDTRVMLAMMTGNPLEHQTAFTVILVVTGFFLFNFGWFREQFCLIACPYGRFQSVFMDEHSLVVGYDNERGEPRKGHSEGEKEGDCINCFKCVSCCPTGIDIRRGTQFECIACTMCIDACDEVMIKVKKPKGLIRYTTEQELEGKKVQHMRARTIAYILLLTLTVGGFALKAVKNSRVQAQFLRGKIPFQLVKIEGREDEVVNHFRVAISNQMEIRTQLFFTISKEDRAKGVKIVVPIVPFVVPSQKKKEAIIFLKFKKSLMKHGTLPVNVKVISGFSAEKGRLETQKVLKLLGPMN